MPATILSRSAVSTLVLVAACACTTIETPLPTQSNTEAPTILLISREDGSIVRQTVDLDADICVKAVDSATTTCLDEGAAIFNGAGVLVGYEMHQTTIQLESAN